MDTCPLGHKHLEQWTPALQEQCPIMFDENHLCQSCGVHVSTTEMPMGRNHVDCHNGYVVCGRCFYNGKCIARDELQKRGDLCLGEDDESPFGYTKCPVTIQAIGLTSMGSVEHGCRECGRVIVLGDRRTRTCVFQWNVCRACYPSSCPVINIPQPENPDAIIGQVIWVDR